MSWLLKRGRIHSEWDDGNRRSAVDSDTSSLTSSEMDIAIRDLLKLNPPKNACEEFFRGSPITAKGKVKQMFKILSIVMIPVIILTCLITHSFVTTFTNYSKSTKIRDTLLYSVELGRVIHYLQEERDMSALYLSSIEDTTKSLLLQRYAETDDSLEKLTFWTTGPTLTIQELKSKDRFLNYLNKHRYELDSLNQTVVTELQMYTILIRLFITWLYDAVKEDESGSIWRSLVAYQEVVIAKEYMGLERALGTIFYAAGKFPSVDVYLWFLESQDVTNATFLSARRYSDLVHDLYENNFNGDIVMLGVLARMRAQLRRNDLDGHGSTETALWWFDNMTVYMDLLLETQRELAVEITEMLDNRQSTNVKKMYAISFLFFCVFVITAITIYAVYSLTDEIQKYSMSLSERSAALNKEKKRTDCLLYQMLPKSVASILKENQTVKAISYPSVTLFFSDIQGFSKISACSNPVQVIQMLNSIYSCFDEIIARFDVFKVETIGDAYMVVSGAPKENGNLHASVICTMAVELLSRSNKLEIPHLPGTRFKLRTGIHTGSVVAAVVGRKMPRYCLFGETVSVAARMEALGKPAKIHISEMTYDALANCEDFHFEERFDKNVSQDLEMMLAMRGRSRTFWLKGKHQLSKSSMNSSLCSSGSENEDGDGKLGKQHAWEDH